MNLKTLTKNELDQRIKNLAQKERDLLHDVILTIKEIDSRQMYFEMGYASLFEYLVSEVGYSNGSAQRRIDAARLLQDVPEVALKIKTGEINLGHTTLVQTAIRQVSKSSSMKISAIEKLEIIEQVSNLSVPQSQKEVASFFDIPVINFQKKEVQADESVRVELTLSKEAYAKLKQAQELLSHAVPTQDIATFIEYLSDKVIKQKTGVGKLQKRSAEKPRRLVDLKTEQIEVSPQQTFSTATMAVGSLSLKTKKIVLQRQNCCQYKEPLTGKICGSKWFLQVDHKQSKWAHGSDDVENLQTLCAAHNVYKYRNESRIRCRS